MKAAKLQLRHYHFNAFSLQSHEDPAGFPDLGEREMYPTLPAGELNPVVSHYEPDSEDPHEFVVNLKLRYQPSEDSSFPYSFLIETEGLFAIDHDGDLEERRRLVAVNGASILYSAMREHLLTLSARHRYGPVLLPCLDFRGMARREVSAEAGDEEP